MNRVTAWPLALLLGCAGQAPGPTPPTTAPELALPAEPPPRVWLDLEPGPYRVGYRQELRFDPARPYDNPLVATPGRPISIHRWYPAEASGQAMRVGDYLELDSPESPRFAELLERHARNVVIGESLGLMASVFASPAELERMDEALAEPVFARRDATPLPGRWPIVLYHPGLGGIFSDNFVLFELLASHGYLVISSSYVPERGSDLSVDWDPKISIADLDFIVRELAVGGERTDETRVAVMGHSYGAQAALIYAMEKRRIDAVISIDSTIENGAPEAPWFRREGTAAWLDRGGEITVPTMIMASRFARTTAFVDSLIASDHHYVVVPVLDHNDFIAHGGVLRSLFAPGTREGETPAADFTRAHAWQLRTIHAFLDGVLQGDAPRLASLGPRWAEELDGASVVYTAARERIEPADVAARFESDGVAGVVALCEPPSVEPRCDPGVVLNELAYDQLRAGEPARAVALLRELVDRYPDSYNLHDSLGEALLHAGERDAAVRAFDRALELAAHADERSAQFQRFRSGQAHRALGSRP